MRNLPFDRSRALGPRLATGTALLAVFMSGCATSLLNVSDSETFGERFARLMANDKKRDVEEDNDFDTTTKVETPLLGEYMSVSGNNLIALRGVGLVTGLDGTGGDPPPSHLRKQLMDHMAKMKIPNPSRLLADRSTALVMVTAYLPAMCRKGQRFDVRVMLPPNSEATSLKGGTLLETPLSEEITINGRRNLKGHEYGIAHGAILTALGDGGPSNAAMLRRGSIPGGAISKTERDLEIILRSRFRSMKTSKGVENAIGRRLHHYDQHGQRIRLATAKTDMMIELKVHPVYRNNFPRYQRMIRSIAYKETDIARRLRTERLSKDLLIPEKAEAAAIELEAVGRDAIPFLKPALTSPHKECRFHAAQALAYLEDSSGVSVLKRVALDEPAFRVYALAALSVINDADSIIALRELIAEGDMETSYGAVRALKENNPNDPVLGTTVFNNQFVLHTIEKSREPRVHVVRYRAPEVCVFGSQQEIRIPAVLNVGNRIRVIGRAGENTVTVTKYRLNAEPERRVVSPRLVDILHAAADLGARYPDIVQMLVEADEQANLIGELGIDRLPQAGRTFLRNKDGDGGSGKATRIGSPAMIPDLFDRVDADDTPRGDETSRSRLSKLFADNGDDTDAGAESSDHSEQAAEQSDDEPDAARASARSSGSQDSPDREEVDLSQIDDLPQSALLPEDSDDAADDTQTAQQSDDSFEAAEFREPLRVRIHRILTSPFRDDE